MSEMNTIIIITNHPWVDNFFYFIGYFFLTRILFVPRSKATLIITRKISTVVLTATHDLSLVYSEAAVDNDVS